MARAPATTGQQDPDALLAHADAVCRRQGMTFTALRREVFGLLSRHGRPAGAYELLDELRTSRPNAAPVTVYRALDFLVSAGLAHRINTLNAFTACRGSDESHRGLILICSRCSQVIELEDRRVETSIQRSAADFAFAADHAPVEVVGTCADCQRSA
ncbi:MAG: transcriptional repressor [Pseudomonadales bacterium]